MSLTREEYCKSIAKAVCRAGSLETVFDVKPILEKLWLHDAEQRATIARLHEEASMREKTIAELEGRETVLRGILNSSGICEDDCEVERLARGIDNIQREIRSW